MQRRKKTREKDKRTKGGGDGGKQYISSNNFQEDSCESKQQPVEFQIPLILLVHRHFL